MATAVRKVRGGGKNRVKVIEGGRDGRDPGAGMLTLETGKPLMLASVRGAGQKASQKSRIKGQGGRKLGGGGGRGGRPRRQTPPRTSERGGGAHEMSGADGGKGDTQEEEGRLGILKVDEAGDDGGKGPQEALADKEEQTTKDTDRIEGGQGHTDNGG